jgi:hypothetical protein
MRRRRRTLGGRLLIKTSRACSTLFENRGPNGTQSGQTNPNRETISTTPGVLWRGDSRAKDRKGIRKSKRGRTEDPLDTIHDNDAQRRLVRIGEDLVEVGDLLGLAEADHVLGRDHLDEGEGGREGDGRGEGGLARGGGAV